MKNIKMVFVASMLIGSASIAVADDGTVDAAKEWRTYTDALAPVGERMAANLADPQDAQSRYELYRFLYSQIALGYFNLLYQDPTHPDWIPYFNLAFNYAFPNPDDMYYVAPLQGEGVYRIRGIRGTVKITDFSVASGSLVPQGIGKLGPTYGNYDLNTLHFSKDGGFDVILSAERPANYKGDWWLLDRRATYVMVRQVSYDWLHENDAKIAIERVDTPAVKPRQNVQQIDAALKAIPGWMEGWTRFSVDWYKRLHDKEGVNAVKVMNYNSQGGLTTQRYMEGAIDIAPDEALIIETTVPKKCRYWNVQLADEFWASIDWVNRQSSLNGHTARLDKDGKFRVVVSAQDPGVPNWLDTSGIKRGIFYGRWTECDSTPTPTTTKVRIAELRKYLPTDTPVVSAEARDAAIRERRMAVQMRKRW